jgi:hypothetical protein
LRNCTRDEGRSFEIGNQVLISSHRKLLLSSFKTPVSTSGWLEIAWRRAILFAPLIENRDKA